MKIFIKNLNGKTIIFEVKPNETINCLKQMIQDYEGILVDQQRLIFEGKYLENERSLNHYNVQNESTIYLNLELQGGGYSFITRNIIIKTYDQQTIKVNVNSEDKIRNLKKVIQHETGIPYFNQCLIFKGQILNDDLYVLSYNISNNSILYLYLKSIYTLFVDPCQVFDHSPIQINIKETSGYTFNLNINPNEPIRTVKLMIQEKGLASLDHQKLLFNGVELQDDVLIDFYNITNNDTLDLQIIFTHPDIQIFVKSGCGFKTFTVDVNVYEKIESVIRKIETVMGIIFDDRFYLCYDCKILNKERTIADYNIQNENTIHVIYLIYF